MGPLQAVSYLLQHGCTAWALGTGWHLRFPWWLSILTASLVRMLGTIGFLAFTSWTLNENVYRLIVTQVHSLVVSYSNDRQDFKAELRGLGGSQEQEACLVYLRVYCS